ncbi:MAG: twin-arginine translocase subunit TatC [bacterium]
MPLLRHLDELRGRIIKSAIAVIVCSIGGWILGPKVLELLAKPVGTLYFFGPTEALVVRMKLALAIGVGLASPVVIYQAWAFVVPALTKTEKRYAVPTLIFSVILFLGGVAFAYFVVMPIGLKVLLSFGGPALKDMIGVQKYFTFVIWLLVACGIVFEMPVVIFFLTKLEIIGPRVLIRRYREAILAIFVASAVVTPSVDVISQLILSIPLMLLYLVSILVSFAARRRRKTGEPEQDVRA